MPVVFSPTTATDGTGSVGRLRVRHADTSVTSEARTVRRAAGSRPGATAPAPLPHPPTAIAQDRGAGVQVRLCMAACVK